MTTLFDRLSSGCSEFEWTLVFSVAVALLVLLGVIIFRAKVFRTWRHGVAVTVPCLYVVMSVFVRFDGLNVCRKYLAMHENGELPSISGSIHSYEKRFQTFQSWGVGGIQFYISERAEICFSGFERDEIDSSAQYEIVYVPLRKEVRCVLSVKQR